MTLTPHQSMKPLETAKIPVAPQLEPIPTFNRDMQNVHLFLNSAKLNTPKWRMYTSTDKTTTDFLNSPKLW